MINLTIGNWVVVAIAVIAGIIITAWIANEVGKKPAIVNAIIATIITIVIIVGFNWYNTSTASGIRHYKDFKSEMSNGIERELVITAEDGREIYRYKGKFDLEMSHADGDRYVRFEDENGIRHTIVYGVQDTVIVTESGAED